VALRQGGLRPTYLARLTIRLEDFDDPGAEDAASEALPYPDAAAEQKARQERAQASLADDRATGRPNLENAAQARRVSQGAAALAGAAGEARKGPAPENVARDDRTITVWVVPTAGSLDLKTFRESDKLSLTFPILNLPILPELIRSMLVDFFMGTATATDFGDPQRWAPLPSRLGAPKGYPKFRGYYTKIEAEADDDTGQVQIEAHSLDQILRDREVYPLSRGREVRSGERLSEFLNRFFQTIPEFSGALGGIPIRARVWPNANEDADPVLDRKRFNRTLQTAASRAQAEGGNVLGAQLAAGQDPAGAEGRGAPQMPAPTAGARFKAWDVVVRAAQTCGLIPLYDPTIDPEAILLVPPQNLYESPSGGVTLPGGARDGFSRTFRQGGAGDPVRSEIRLMVWGKNISDMKFSRQAGRHRPRAVRVVSYNPDARGAAKLVSAQFPATPRGVAVSPLGTETRTKYGKGHRPVEEIVHVTVQGLRTEEACLQEAVSLYHAISKREMSCVLTTRDLASYVDPTFPVDQNDDPDLFRLRPGSPIRVMVARQQVDLTKELVVDSLSQVFERKANRGFLREMLAKGAYRAGTFRDERDVATLEDAVRKIEEAYARARLTDHFFVREVSHKFSTDGEGEYSCRIAVFNYLEARNNPRLLGPDDQRANDAAKAVKPGGPKKDPVQEAADANLDHLMRRSFGLGDIL
jgi:hypothetical protein